MSPRSPRFPQLACVNVGATGSAAAPSGRAYIGSVSDDPYDIRTRLVVRRTPGRYAFIGTELVALASSNSDPEYLALINGGPTRGLNERGLAFTWTLAGEKADHRAPEGALSPARFWETVAESCASVDEALALMPTLQRDFSGSLMLADRDGNLALVEAGRQVFHVRERYSRERGGAAVNVNCWLAMQEQAGDPICALDNPAVPNQSRFGRACELLAQLGHRLDLEGMRRILTDHANCERFAGENPWMPGLGYSICNHGSLRPVQLDLAHLGWGSVSAEIIDPVTGVFWYAYGWPCGEPPTHADQLLQERSWGTFIGFPLDGLPAGEYTTITGELTPLAARQVGRLRPWGAAGEHASQPEPALAGRQATRL